MRQHVMDDSKNVNNNEKYVQRSSMVSKMITCGAGVRQLLQIGLRCDLDDVENNPFDGIDKAIFIVPGNPGGIIFYRYFMESLYKRLGLPVFGLSHVGLARGSTRFQSGPMTVRRLMDDELQVLDNFVPQHVSLILVGHSIGSFIVKDMMRLAEDKDRYIHGVLLSPTLQSLSDTPGARGLTILTYMAPLFYSIVFLLSLLPEVYQLSVTRSLLRFAFDDFAECSAESLIETVNVGLLRRARDLARDEFLQVQDLDVRSISKNLHRLSFIYTDNDEWVPRSHFDNLKSIFPDADAVTVPSTLHTFNFSLQMTNDVLDVVCKKLQKYGVTQSFKY